jgi:O-antigen/teichoic acid export membrane protein
MRGFIVRANRRRHSVKHAAPPKRTLGSVASRALGWSFLSTAVSRLGIMGLGIFLARLLGPHEFGTAAVAYVAFIAILSFNELGVTLAIVRWPGDPSEIASTVATIAVVSSLVLYIALYAVAPEFSSAMGSPAATPVVRVLGISIVTSGAVNVPAALLERSFLQGRKIIADQVHSWLAAIISVVCAWTGFGAMSLAIGQVVGCLAGGIIITAFSPLPLRLGFNRSKARALLRFGLPLAGSSLIVFFVANVDNLVVGHVLGATALGCYVLAWNLSSWPVNMFSQPVRSVAPALFSRLQKDPGAMRTGFVSTAGLLGSVTFPVCLLLSGAAVPIIALVYGQRWAPAAGALKWLAVLAALRILFELTYDYFVVLTRSRLIFTVQLAWLLALIPALILGAKLSGIAGVGAAGAAVAGGVVLPCYAVALLKAGVRLRRLASRLWLPVLVAVAIAAAARVISRVISNDFDACAVSGVVALMAVALLLVRMRPVIAELRPVLNRSADIDSVPASTDSAPGTAAHDPAHPGREFERRQSAALEALIALSSPVGAMGQMKGAIPAFDPMLPAYWDTMPGLGSRSSSTPESTPAIAGWPKSGVGPTFSEALRQAHRRRHPVSMNDSPAGVGQQGDT